jgi:helicase required for RNAi-mediated heterochromatin assembly 1
MDPGQLRALKAVLTREVAVVQGPPGTGKTYLALKAMKAILDNREDTRGPIFVIA